MKNCKKLLLLCAAFLLCFLFFLQGHSVLAASYSALHLDIEEPYKVYFVGETYDFPWYTTDGKEHTASDFYFKSSNPKIASISATGKLKAIRCGDVTISMTGKKDKSLKASTKIHIYQDRLVISCASKSLRAGKTYQLKGNHKNVRWNICNVDGEYARASIDSRTGKIIFRDPGEAYISAKTTDGKYFGAMYLTAGGPVVSGTVKFKTVTVKKDLHLNTIESVVENDLLPKTITLPYTYGKKKGKVKCTLDYMYSNYFGDYSEPGTYEIRYRISTPDGYTFGKMNYYDLKLVVKEKQTDTRTKIVKFEPLKITLNKDFHVVESYEIISNYLIPNNIPLIGITESGEKVEFKPQGARSAGDFYSYSKLGTYKQVSISAAEQSGYSFDDSLSAPMTLTIKKKQTPDTPADYTQTLDYIPGVLYVSPVVTQKKLR